MLWLSKHYQSTMVTRPWYSAEHGHGISYRYRTVEQNNKKYITLIPITIQAI